MKQRVAIIGSGLAGTAVAELLCREGWKVALIDRAPATANDSSGNPAGITMPYLSPAKHNMQRVYNVATDIAWRSMRELFDKGLLPSWNPCGALEVPAEPRIKILIESGCYVPGARVVAPQEASEILGTEVSQRCLYMERAAVVSPRELCEAHIASAGANLEQVYLHEVGSIEQIHGLWRALGPDGRLLYEADAMVIANAGDCHTFSQTKDLHLETLRGTLAVLPGGTLLQRLRTAFCFQGYVLPEASGSVVLGATFAQPDSPYDSERFFELISQLRDWLPRVGTVDFAGAVPRMSLRTATHDRLPYIGAVPGYSGLYVSVGHGVRGLSSAHLAARMLKDLINANGAAPPDEIFDLVSPARCAKHPASSQK